MASWGGLILCGAYILGLLITGLTKVQWLGYLSLGGGGLLCAGCIAGGVVPRFWRGGPSPRQWCAAGIVAMIAASYCLKMAPEAAPNDVSRLVSPHEQRVVGEVIGLAQTNRQGKGQFYLRARSIRSSDSQQELLSPRTVSGKLYVTAPLSASQKLFPGEVVELSGELYEVQRASQQRDKGSFGDYLARQDCFAGFRAHWIEFLPGQAPPRWALWRVRARIVQAQERWLGEPAGSLLSAMTLGRQAVDLPTEIKDSFIAAGLAHTLAASGFHVSLMLGLVLGMLRSRSPKAQAIMGGIALILYVSLTGLQPSVVRAAVMGAGALVGLAFQRQMKPLGCLLVAVTLILLCNPQWIWDVGFQLSAFATLGLMVMVPGIMRWLDWLPTNIATLLAVPLAAYLWTVPLQLHYFEVLPTYSILLNALVTPLVVLVSTGGFVSAIAALIWPVVGSAIAANLYYPIHLLIWLADASTQLPAHALPVTAFGVWQVIASYTVYIIIGLWLWRRQVRHTQLLTAD